MADDNSNHAGQDQSCISMKRDFEVHYWTEKLSVSKEELLRAINKVGPSAGAVEQELRRSHVGHQVGGP